jgi:hypothetical protein
MATFTYKNHAGLTGGHAANVRAVVGDLVQTAAKNVSWNMLGTAPANFGTKTETEMYKGRVVSQTVKSVHAKTNIEFTAGFQMFKSDNGAQQKWEGQAVSGGYRLDLQGIENGWANWAIQTNGSNSETVASCLMKVGCCFGQGQLIHGLIQSAERHQLCELTP